MSFGTIGKSITFSQLFSNNSRIEIPIIQRDFAQGRESASEVRDQFLNAIYSKLATPPDSLAQPLDLDFIYGSMNGSEPNIFSPLDGQQRLTTLFLMHWYLACLDNVFDDFRALVLDDRESRFTYQTRTSSSEFFHALARESVDLEALLPSDPTINNSMSKTIQDRQWFFLSWTQDPTIKSALVMLDAIHAQFSNSFGFYSRLSRAEQPYITFQFLNLKDFGLSDELYIKMNSRGKPLTPFENFKAKLEQHIGHLFPTETMLLPSGSASVKDYFSHKVDTDWADLFWHFRDEQKRTFDDQIMNFIRSFAGVHYPRNRSNWVPGLSDLRDSSIDFSYAKYQELACFNRDDLASLISFLDGIHDAKSGIRTFLRDTSYFDEQGTFKLSLEPLNVRSKSGLGYEESVQFFAYVQYVARFSPNIDSGAFSDWMRVVCNLSANTPYNNLYEFKPSLDSINQLLNHADSILEFFCNADSVKEVKGFYSQQIREEHIKAQLIIKGDEWRDLIIRAEMHGYFRGQIEFLLSFSGVLDYYLANNDLNWSGDEDTGYFHSFASYLEKASMIFSENGLNSFPDFLWERALLATGDYLIGKGRNLSFLDDNDRDASWKRLLRGAEQSKDFLKINAKRAFVKAVMDKFDIDDPKQSLLSIIESTTISDDWRRMIVEQPEIFAYCTNRFIRRHSNESILLMSKIKTSGNHLELYSFYLMLTDIRQRIARNELRPFSHAYEHAVNTDDESPKIVLSGCRVGNARISVDIYFVNGRYQVQIAMAPSEELLKLKEDLISRLGCNELHAGKLDARVCTADISALLDNLILLLRTHAAEHTASQESSLR